MPADGVVATVSQMRDAAAKIGASAQRISDAMDVVDQNVNALGPSVFMSDAADAFRSSYYQLTPKLRDALTGLNVFDQKLRETADELVERTKD